MDRVKCAAIIMLGMGEKCAAEILKTMSPREVQLVIEAINQIDNVTDFDVIKALNEFFKETNNTTGLDIASREALKNSLASVAEHGRIGVLGDDFDNEKSKWIELFKWQSPEFIVPLIQDEHPQVIAIICALILDSEKASRIIKMLPKNTQSEVISRMAKMGSISAYAMDVMSDFFRNQLDSSEKHNAISVDGVEAVANIISYLDTESERQIMNDLSQTNAVLTEKIQERIFTFDRLAQLDARSLQTLLAEVKSEDLVIALKGVDDYIKQAFLKNMSSKSAEILKDEMESKGPVKIATVVEAQKRIISIAKKLGEEEKIILSTKNDPDVVF